MFRPTRTARSAEQFPCAGERFVRPRGESRRLRRRAAAAAAPAASQAAVPAAIGVDPVGGSAASRRLPPRCRRSRSLRRSAAGSRAAGSDNGGGRGRSGPARPRIGRRLCRRTWRRRAVNCRSDGAGTRRTRTPIAARAVIRRSEAGPDIRPSWRGRGAFLARTSNHAANRWNPCRDVQRVAIVDPSDATREELRNVLLGMESVWLEAECARYEFFFDVIRQSSPDVVIVSLDSDQTKALQLIAQLTQVKPDLPILAVSAKGDGQAILQALRSGASEFLTAPVVLEELLKALQRLSGRGRRHDSRHGNGVATAQGRFAGHRRPRLARRRRLHQPGRQPRRHAGPGPDQQRRPDRPRPGPGRRRRGPRPDGRLHAGRRGPEHRPARHEFLRRSLSQARLRPVAAAAPGAVGGRRLIREEHLQRVIGLLRASYHASDPRPEQELLGRPT